MATTTPVYGDKVDPAEVSYEPPTSSAEVGYYYLVATPDSRVVWVREPQLHPTDPAAGFFAIYVGALSEYAPNVEATA